LEIFENQTDPERLKKKKKGKGKGPEHSGQLLMYYVENEVVFKE
jgi:hypothetical protein